ncbi:MAG: serine/threonine-protein kinase, partial [Dokdonella sp.]
MTEPTRPNLDPSDSMLMSLARVAMTTASQAGEANWPSLDLNDPDQRAFGDYELLEEMGRGGMGVVYRARQRSLERDVAIKFIATGIADTINVARFLGEARAAARLMHPNIVSVHEVGSIDGVHYFSMPLVRGQSLATLLDERRLTETEAVTLLLKLCDAIDYAHRLGLLHLDLKPANVLIDERGEPLVADFGLARHMDERNGIDAQEVSGTPSFMAPEQVLIKQFRLTPATDLYALGAILYRALTGVSPHGTGAPDELTQRAIAGRVKPLRELNPAVSADLGAVCMKCLELVPRDRYVRVADLADDLRRIRDGHPVSVRTPGAWERLRRWYQRDRRYARAIIAVAIAVSAGTAFSASGWLLAEHRRDIAETQRELADQERRS